MSWLDMMNVPKRGQMGSAPDWESIFRRINSQSRMNRDNGIMSDRDFYVSPFAPRSHGEGPVGLHGQGFGQNPSMMEQNVMPPPNTPDKMEIDDNALLRWYLDMVRNGQSL